MVLKNPLLHRFWVEAKTGEAYGVTAYSESEAIAFSEKIATRLNRSFELADIKIDIDISTLDSGHVLPNMGLVTERGVWYPNVKVSL